MLKTTRYLLALYVLGVGHQLSAYIYDNRFFRILRTPYSRERYFCDPCHEQELGFFGESRYRNDAFILTANDAVGDDDTIGIPEVFGRYDMGAVDAALVSLGNPSKCVHDLEGETAWRMKGKLQGQGFSFAYDQKILDWFSAGCSFSFLHMTTRHMFFLTKNQTHAPEDKVDAKRRELNDDLGIEAEKWSHSGITDIETYVRFGNVWNYVLKCRRIDAGISFGALLPAGEQRSLQNPASVPFGGDGHYGFFTSLDAEFELKEDIKFGFLFRISKRFAKTKLERMPIKKEQQLYGALIAPTRIDPGTTVIFSPYLRIEGIRDGLGFYVNYTMINHDNDCWQDARKVDRTPMPTLFNIYKKSDWRAEIVTLNFYYDFTKVRVPYNFLPSISLSWDIPVSYLWAENVVQTNNIALGIEFRF